MTPPLPMLPLTMPICRLGGPLAKTLCVLWPISRRYKLLSALKDVDGHEIGQRDAVFPPDTGIAAWTCDR